MTVDHQDLRPSFPDGPPISREQRVTEILKKTGAILTNGHFLLSSGLHAETYINKDQVYPHTRKIREIGGMIAEDFRDSSIEAVVGPVLGGVSLSHVTAAALTDLTGVDIPAVYAEKSEDGGFKFTRGYQAFVEGKRVLVVEDVLTTGGSVRKVLELVRNTGGEVVAVAVIVNRGGVTAENLGVDTLNSLIEIQMPTYNSDECPKCARGAPIDTQVGAGKNLANGQVSF